MKRARLTGAVLAAAALSLLAGCSQMPLADESYQQKIPAALEAADLGLADVWADSSLSGFTETLSVGGTLTTLGDSDRSLLDEPSTETIDDGLVQRIVAISLAERTMPFEYFTLSLDDAAGDDIDVESALERLGAETRSDGSISMDEAEQIAEASGGAKR